MPSPLPPELAEFLRHQERVALFHGTEEHGTVAVVKLLPADIDSSRGRVPIALRHELYTHPAAPVIRTVLTIYDRPRTPLALETFTNVDDQLQRAEFAALAEQAELLLLMYDERLRHRLTKRVPLAEPAIVAGVVRQAETYAAAIAPALFDFDRAKLAVMERTRL